MTAFNSSLGLATPAGLPDQSALKLGDTVYQPQAVPMWPAVDPPSDRLLMMDFRLSRSLVRG